MRKIVLRMLDPIKLDVIILILDPIKLCDFSILNPIEFDATNLLIILLYSYCF